jgi:murein L,D-transpeptidase YcbB/YkuD
MQRRPFRRTLTRCPNGSTKSMRHTVTIAGMLALTLFSVVAGSFAQGDNVRQLIRGRTEELRARKRLTVEGASIAAVNLIPRFYERRGFQPAWTKPGRASSLVGIVSRMDSEGLDPEDYYLSTLKSLLSRAEQPGGLDPAQCADFDILLTESLIRLGYHLRFGKVDPVRLDPNWNFTRSLGEKDPVDILESAISADSIQRFIEDEIPQLKYYDRLKTALARYREIAGQGDWPVIPSGPALKPGTTDSRVTLLRERLRRSGDLAETGAKDASPFDEALKQAVISFQRRHGLAADGVVHKDTLNALNVSIKQRIDQIRVNLERARWAFHDIHAQDEFVVVDIAGYHVYFVRDGKTVFDARAQVGKPYRKTPIFRAAIKFMQLNPTWTVPPGILSKDILPKVKQNPNYLKQKELNVIDRNGRRVAPGTVDWKSISSRGFPYQLQQDPGPNNALGRVKFLFPNPYSVYLHDTPSRDLFEAPRRAFSSGCIRVQHPLTLAEILLKDPVKWNQKAIQEVIDSGKTRTVNLSEPVTVMLLYWTAEVTPEGVLQFREDIYGRDQKVLHGLKSHFQFSIPVKAQSPK